MCPGGAAHQVHQREHSDHQQQAGGVHSILGQLLANIQQTYVQDYLVQEIYGRAQVVWAGYLESYSLEKEVYSSGGWSRISRRIVSRARNLDLL